MNSTARSFGASAQLSEPPATIGEFRMRFTSTPRGARLARRLVSHRLDEWGYPYESDINESVTLITGELTANAVRHGHVPGRDFAVRLTVTTSSGALCFRIEVSDVRTERLPAMTSTDVATVDPDGVPAESGRGLLVVSCLAVGWGVVPRPGGPGKTIWAEFAAGARTAAR